jgi:hypothetical protein
MLPRSRSNKYSMTHVISLSIVFVKETWAMQNIEKSKEKMST